ncbi:adhesion G protein-coupled receptor E5 isoform X2 [Dromaius novaehollandiae]|uniref:adhesion G protein-coupled receptor E5 isoform X2 n=1 Tax=Dromaius novaehollandiae TaxID=8790 RepID=UPI00311D700D
MGPARRLLGLGLCLVLGARPPPGLASTMELCSGCGEGAVCFNSTHCTCPPGLRPLGPQAVFDSPTEACDDINECTEQPPPMCPGNRECHNTRGSYTCTCISGYREPPPGQGSDCLDVDECREAAAGRCRPHGFCVNRPGGFACACRPGYAKSSRDPLRLCTDVDECQQPVCGAGAQCRNTPGSYTCVCPPGGGTWVAARAACHNDTPPPLPPELCPQGQPCAVTETLARLYGELEGGLEPRRFLQALVAVLDGALGLAALGAAGDVVGRHREATALLAATEELVRRAAARLPETTVTVTSANGTELRLAVRRAPPRSPLRLQDPEVQLEVPGEVAADGDTGWALAALLSQRALGRVLEGAAGVRWEGWERLGPPGGRGRPTYRVLSPVASAFVARARPPRRGDVTLRFAHPPPDPRRGGRLLCAFWHPERQRWATDGCRLVATASGPPGSTCACDHLTSFAVLLAFYEPEDWGLDVVTKVGLSLSLLCLLLAIVTFLFCRALQGLRTTIHLHLCATLFVAYALFLLGIERTADRTACAVVAGLLHFSFLAAFCWMGLEGLHLYLLLVRVFAPSALRRWHLLLAGYGLPALVVAASAAAFPQGYGTERHCWLSLDRGFRWSFQAPVCVIIAVNAVIFVITIWKLVQKFSDVNPDMGHLRRMRVLTVTAVAQLCLLGTTWALGLLQLGPRSLPLSYLFSLLNCAQGLFILALHCLAHPQVRDAYRAWLCPGAKRYAEFSSSGSTFSSRVPRQESGM